MEVFAPLLAQFVIPGADRALALMDQDPSSPTYGMMDRAFWYYRTLTNFPGATWQQPMAAFAALYATRHETNPFGGMPRIREAAQASLLAWCRGQKRGGSFDEWYLNEHSYCPTAITTAGAVITLDLLGDKMEERLRQRAIGAAISAAQWLSERYNPSVMNQNLASVVALSGLARVTGEKKWRERAESVLARVANDQSSEGWLPEYGGFDFGYSTLALDFLALAADFGLAEAVSPMVQRAVAFLLAVTEPNCPLPGRIGSRGSSHAFLAGAIALARHDPDAGLLAARLLELHRANLATRPADIDDRYFAYFYFPSFALAFRFAAAENLPSFRVPDELSAERSFDYPLSGLAGRTVNQTLIVMNRRLGGALAVTSRGGAALYHLGYTATTSAGARYSSAGWTEEHTPVEDGFSAHSAFRKVSGGQPLRHLMVPFQTVAQLLFTSRLAEAFQVLVKKAMISPKATYPLELQRTVTSASEKIVIQDHLSPKGKMALRDLHVTSTITMHSPSARQDVGASVRLPDSLRERLVDRLNRGDTVDLCCIIERASKGSFDATFTEGTAV